MTSLDQRPFWLSLAGASIIAIVAATPILMSVVMDRGFELAKQNLAEPLSVLALGAALLAGCWQAVTRQGPTTKIAASSLLVFLALAVVSTCLSENAEVALFGGYYRREGLLAWGVYGAFFFAMLAWGRTPSRIAAVIDVLLIASVVPAVYVLQQRFGLDFYLLGTNELARPGSTLGNPVFLAAYLAVLLPLTVMRCRQSRGRRSELALWTMLAALQAAGLLATQSRGPLIAAVAGVFMLGCLIAAYARARRFFVAIFVLLAVIVAAVVAINSLDGARRLAQDQPVIGRLIFNLERGAIGATDRASRSAAARLDVWGAGIAAFSAAPMQIKLIGYGPESAYTHYFSHMPASVMRLIGHGADHSFDRLHADTLDIGLNFGFIGWAAYFIFFCAVFYAAAKALFGIAGRSALGMFAATTLGGGTLFAVASIQAGLGSAFAPAFGLGVGAGWTIFMLCCAWRRMMQGGIERSTTLEPFEWLLLAGLTSALLVFWLDAQVNIAVLTTRLISFAIAALMLVIASRTGDASEKDADRDDVRVWGVAFALVAACASWLPAVGPLDPGAGEAGGRWVLRLLPVVTLLLFVAWSAFGCSSREFNKPRPAAWLSIALGFPALYVAVHWALVAFAAVSFAGHPIETIAVGVVDGAIFISAMCLTFAWRARNRVIAAANPPSVSARLRLSAAAIAILLVMVSMIEWRATRAAVASRLALHPFSFLTQASQQLIGEAIRLAPYEREYRRQLVFDLLGKSIADIRQLSAAPERVSAIERNLDAAESQARIGALLFPHDPWTLAALANVLQIRALQILRPYAAVAGVRAAREANDVFSRTHSMFPAEPLVLRNWAQLWFDQGNLVEAYRLLDRMEQLIPDDPEPYIERITMAKQVGDRVLAATTLERAQKNLKPQSFDSVLVVAHSQQP
ncbi:MAG: hypothetical protein JWN94_1468 [Betaproteobacteria bacterium]|nr:hypothetical protein [Betaproteobacteria bacterium]